MGIEVVEPLVIKIFGEQKEKAFNFDRCAVGEDDSSVCIDGRTRFARRDEMQEPALCQCASPAKPNGFRELKMKGRKRSFERRVLPMFAKGAEAMVSGENR